MDDTLINEYHNESGWEFKRFYVQNHFLNDDVLLVYNTGRSFKEFEQVQKRFNMLFPDFLICLGGTKIVQYNERLYDSSHFPELVEKYHETFAKNWDYSIIEKSLGQLQWLYSGRKELSGFRFNFFIPKKLMAEK